MKILIHILAFVIGGITAVVFLNSIKQCHNPKPTTKPDLKQAQRTADSILIENLKRKSDTVWMRFKEVHTLTHEVRIHDTLNQRFTDSSYCHNMEKENDILIESHSMDSGIIITQERVIKTQDTVINNLSGAYNNLEKQARKSESRANFEAFRKAAWRTISIIEAAVLVGLSVK